MEYHLGDSGWKDYLGVAIHDGTAWVAWADNTETSDDGPNPEPDTCDGELYPCMDLFVTQFVPEPSGRLPLLAGVVSLGLMTCVGSWWR